jgi:hypothetical protein
VRASAPTAGTIIEVAVARVILCFMIFSDLKLALPTDHAALLQAILQAKAICANEAEIS